MPKPKVFVARRIFQEAIDMIAAEADVDLWSDELHLLTTLSSGRSPTLTASSASSLIQ